MPSQPDEHPFVLHLTRFAVPGLILVFYVTAAHHFEYTPEGTFSTLVGLGASPPASLWSAFLTSGDLLRLDSLLVAKIFSLVLCSFVLLFSYLIAHEVLEDRLIALCAVLALALQAWLVQLAPSGSGLSSVLFLNLAAIFFLLRNNYIVASVVSGLAALVSWQSIVLLPVLLFDAYINSIEKGRSARLAASILLVFAGVLLPWVLYAVYSGAPVIPNEVGRADVPTLLPHLSFEMVLLVGVMFIGVAVLASRERQVLRTHTAVLLWIACASFTDHRMFAVTLPLIVVYAFFSVQQVLLTFGRSNVVHLAGIVLAALILAYNQFVVLPVTTDVMHAASAIAAELKSASVWVRTNSGEDEAVRAPLDHYKLVEFYAERRIDDINARFRITSESQVDGFEIVFDPVVANPELLTGSASFKVWRRK